jgi:hypothetical protein
MSKQINFSKLILQSRVKANSAKETAALRAMIQDAREFVESFAWCKRVLGAYLGLGVGQIVAVVLVRILPAKRNVDPYFWIVVGDLPPAYLVTDDAPNPACALKAYIQEMRRWVNAVRQRRSVTNLIPVNVPPTLNYAEQLAERLDVLEFDFLSYYARELESGGATGKGVSRNCSH